MPSVKLGIVGLGARGYWNLQCAYNIHERKYFLREPSETIDGVHGGNDSESIYHKYAGEVPDWAEDISDLQITVSAIFDPDPAACKRAVDLCQDYGDDPTVFEDWEAFLASTEYDAAVVSTPNHTHPDIVIPLMNQGIDVFCEKPLATTLEDHDRIIDADRNNSGLFYVGFNMRHSPIWSKLRETIQRGEIGKLGMISVHEVRSPFPDGHYYTDEESGGSLLEKDCHDFDWFNSVVNADPVKVYALGGQHVFTENNDVNDHATVICEYENGVKATLELCLYAPFSQSHRRQLAIRGSEGVIRTPEDGEFVIHTKNERIPIHIETEGSHGGADLRMWHDVLSAMIRGTERMASPMDAKKASAIALGAEKAIKEDQVINILDNYELE